MSVVKMWYTYMYIHVIVYVYIGTYQSENWMMIVTQSILSPRCHFRQGALMNATPLLICITPPHSIYL